MLAELAEDSDSSSSQMASQVASQVLALEEQDSVLVGSPDKQEMSEEKDETETLEMSQQVWHGMETDEE